MTKNRRQKKKPPSAVGRPLMPSLTPLGERLREARLAKELTMQRVAKVLKITLASVSRHESGVLEPTLARLAQYARLYGVDPRDLAYGRGN